MTTGTGWQIVIPGRPVSLNAERSGSRYKRHENTKAVRQMAQILWRDGVNRKVLPAKLDRISVTAHCTAKDGRWHIDLGSALPTAKAAIDGIVDAGLIPNDTDRHLVSLTFEPTRITGVDSLVLTIRERTQP